MTTKARSTMQLMAEICEALRDGSMFVTALTKKTRQNHQNGRLLLDKMVTTGLIVRSTVSGHEMYTITIKGMDFVADYERMKEYMDVDAEK